MNVSVCMATHNGARYLRQQIDSILCQLAVNDELIVSDDHSTDETISIIHSYSDSRIKLLGSQKFGSPTKNFEHALSHCNHSIIFLADQDDVWYENKINVMKNILQQNDLVVCDCRIVNEDLMPLQNSYFTTNHSTSGLVKNLIKNSFIGCCMAFRKTVLERALPFPQDITMHDHWLGLVAERYFKVTFIPIVLVDHRRHQENYSSTGSLSENSLSKKIKSRIRLAKELCVK